MSSPVRPKGFGPNFRPNMPQIWPTNKNFQKIKKKKKKNAQGFTQTIQIKPLMPSLEHPKGFRSTRVQEQVPRTQKSKFSKNEKSTPSDSLKL